MRAQSLLGTLYYGGFEDIVEQDLKKARHWLRKAAHQGDDIAQYYLGEMYFYGSAVRTNYKEAFKWYKKSAGAGYVEAVQKLAHCYLNGIGTRQNEEEGYWCLACLALHGDEEARILLQSAADVGNSFAEYGLAVYYYNKDDIETANHWLEKSATQGHAKALCGMARWSEKEGNNEERLRYFRLAAEKGDAEAQTQLALLLEDISGTKTPENEEAFKWMKAAADQEHPSANYYLGNFYRSGTWGEPDGNKAFECYVQAADQGDSDAMDRLGECFDSGTGVAQDTDIAFQCFQCAAHLGNPKGQCNLGLYYLSGLGCHQDTELGFQWISQAADSGLPIVFQMLERLGLDIAKLCDGYKRSRKVWSNATGDWFDENFEKVLSESPLSILPIPPSDKVGRGESDANVSVG